FFFIFYSPQIISQENAIRILTEANIEIPRLSPIPQEVQMVQTPIISLNGTWEVSLDGADPKPIEVPGELIMQGYRLNIGETAYYRRNIEIPEDWKNKHVFIRFDGVSSYAVVKLNGIPIMEHEGGFVP